MNPDKYSQFNLTKEHQSSAGYEKNQEIEQKTPKRSQIIFDNIYDQLKPQTNIDSDRIKAGKVFIKDLAEYQDVHIEKIDENAQVDQSLEKIWMDMVKNLDNFRNDPNKFEQRKTEYGRIYLKFKNHIDRLIKSGEVDQFTAKVFLENFRALKTNRYYNDITRNSEKSSDESREKYHIAAQDLYSIYKEDKIIEQGGFYHFNSKNRKNAEVANRIYLSANLEGSPEKLVNAWKNVLTETGFQDKIYFKLSSHLASRFETIIIYQTSDITDEDMRKVMEAFQRLCPIEARSKKDMPSSAPVAQGISYAPEPKNLNELFDAMNLKKSENDDTQIGVSYNEMIAGFTQLSFELAYKDFKIHNIVEPIPKDLKDSAGKYFEQMVKLAGINPDTMVPNTQGGKLPIWAEKISND